MSIDHIEETCCNMLYDGLSGSEMLLVSEMGELRVRHLICLSLYTTHCWTLTSHSTCSRWMRLYIWLIFFIFEHLWRRSQRFIAYTSVCCKFTFMCIDFCISWVCTCESFVAPGRFFVTLAACTCVCMLLYTCQVFGFKPAWFSYQSYL